MAAFLAEELEAFIQQPTAQAQERKAILAALRDDAQCPASPELIQRLQELCFLPGLIFPQCLFRARFLSDMRYKTRKQRDRLRALCRQTKNDPLLSDALKERMQREVEILTELLQEHWPPPQQVDQWRVSA